MDWKGVNDQHIGHIPRIYDRVCIVTYKAAVNEKNLNLAQSSG